MRHFEYPPSEWTAFARFPTWMWRNNEVRELRRLAARAQCRSSRAQRAAFHGLDLYSLHNSIRAVLEYLDEVDPEAAEVARERYGCLTPWQSDPATYGRAALTGRYRILRERGRADAGRHPRASGANMRCATASAILDAVQNARLVANAERYYRIMYYGSRASWNLRDSHMFETLKTLLDFYGPDSKAVVWAHNSHIGDAAATEMSIRGEHNLGQLCRREFGSGAYLIGFGTDRGTVAAASDWDGPMQIKAVRPAMPKSYERQCHAALESGRAALHAADGTARRPDCVKGCEKPRLERAIGVIYRPETELASHYFQAVLPQPVRRIYLVRSRPAR